MKLADTWMNMTSVHSLCAKNAY